MRFTRWGRGIFAITLAGLGILGLVQRDFTAIWQPAPRWIPLRGVVVLLTAVVPLACGIGLLRERAAAAAAKLLLGFLLAWLLLVDGPQLLLRPGMQMVWATAKTAAMVAATWVLDVRLAGTPGTTSSAFAGDGIGLRIARRLYGLALIPFGVAHFTYVERTAGMVPAWLPWHLAWAYFFGCTFVAAGIAVLVDVRAGLAATLSALQLAMFTVLVWVPVVATGPSASDWRELVTSWTLTAAAWVVAESYFGTASASRAER